MVDDAMRSMNFSKLNQDIGRDSEPGTGGSTTGQFGGYRDTDFLPHVDPHSKYDRCRPVQVATEYGRSEAYL